MNAREEIAAPFFQPGHTYARQHHASTIRFLVRYIDDSPEGIPYRVAFGWKTEDGDVCASPFDSDDMDGWVDVTEPAPAPDFFVPGCVYTRIGPFDIRLRFVCEHVTTDPKVGDREAWGWLHRSDGTRRMDRMWDHNYPGWTPEAGDQ